MVKLLIADQENTGGDQIIRFGGRPVSASGAQFEWPVCAHCDGHMQYLGQLAVSDSDSVGPHLLQMFMCQNDPGMCEEWDAEGGGNRVLVLPIADTKLSMVDPPENGNTILGGEYGVEIVEVDGDEYDVARERWMASSGQPGRLIAGQLSGTPEWIQFDETPNCSQCGVPMRFIAQLEEGPDVNTSMNFGGGSAYVFECVCGQARFLWQQ